MNTNDLLALLPLLLIAASAVVVMLGIGLKRSPALAVGFTLGGLIAAFVSIWAAVPVVPRQVTPLLLVDNYALFYIGLIVASAAGAKIHGAYVTSLTGWKAVPGKSPTFESPFIVDTHSTTCSKQPLHDFTPYINTIEMIRSLESLLIYAVT